MVNKERTEKLVSQRKFYLLSFALCLAASPALAAPLQNWRYNPATNQLEITVKPGVKPRYTFAAYPARIILELPNTEVGNVKLQESYSGAVRQIQVAQSQSTARITLVLAPDVVLSKEQAQLQQVREQSRSSDRWVFRPLLANTANTTAVPRLSAVTTAPRAGKTAPSTPPPVVYPPGLSPSETSSGATGNPGVLAPPASAMDLPPSEAPPAAIPTPPTADQFPPGLAPSSGRPSVTVPTTQPDLPQTPPREVVSQAPQSSSEVVAQAPPTNPLRLPEVNPSLAIPDSLPPVSAPTTPTAPTVSVPPLQQATPTTGAGLPPTITESFSPPTAQPLQPAQSVLGAPLQPQTPQVLPQALPQALPQPVPLQPDLTSQFSQSLPPSIPQTTTVATAGTIEFGQPLPIGGRSSSSSYGNLPSQPPLLSVASSTEGVILPSGTLLNLSYPGSQVLKLEANKPRQEVVLLQTEIRDRAGNLIIPFGSQVYGRFETNRFIAQSIAIGGRSFPFAAQSDALGGARQVNDRRLLINSGIGAVAGALLGGLSGGTVAGGAAVGAGVTYATAPKPATIAPGQIFQVRLTQDLR